MLLHVRKACKGCRASSITEMQCAYLQVVVELAMPLQRSLMAPTPEPFCKPLNNSVGCSCILLQATWMAAQFDTYDS